MPPHALTRTNHDETLVSRIHPLSQDVSVNHISNLLLDKRRYDVVSPPVADAGRPTGLLAGSIQHARLRLGSPYSEAAEISG
ncbi:MAG: hypothetical protein P8011_07225 [Acidihalobacter sp.]|uniref:hypothetical protein n=1 Tax=Acidihalobacter sp. TaxID=1872108 RepID=UPI00307F8645